MTVNESELLPDNRFAVLYALSMLSLVGAMNKYAEQLGRLVYFGRNELFVEDIIDVDSKYPFIAVFDDAAIPVLTMEDVMDLKDKIVGYVDDPSENQGSLSKYKVANTA